MKGRDFAANAACVRGIEIAFPPSSLLFVPVFYVGANRRCKDPTARASRVCRTRSQPGQFVKIETRQKSRARFKGGVALDTSKALGRKVR